MGKINAMIKGIGTDIVKVSRIGDMMARHSSRFLGRVFTPREILQASNYKPEKQYFAARWAAKEAFSKALGTGIGEKCAWLDINVVSDLNGRPSLEISGTALETAKLKGIENIQVSISHEDNYAIAFVVLEGD